MWELFKVVEDRPEVEAEECMHWVGFVIKLSYVEVKGGQIKQTVVLPAQSEIKTTQPAFSLKTFKGTFNERRKNSATSL